MMTAYDRYIDAFLTWRDEDGPYKALRAAWWAWHREWEAQR